MGPSLRQRLSKRASETTEVKSSSTATDTAPPLLAALTHLQPPSTSKEDLDVTTPPSDNIMLPRTPEKALESPASLLERYKERTPIAKAPAMPSPSEVLSMARSRIPNFPDNFDTSKELPLTPTPIYPPSGIPVATAPVKSTIRTVGGVDFQMVNSTQIATDVLQPRSSSAEPARAGVDGSGDIGLLGQRRRLTRSQSRKEERSDSTVDDISAETLQANIEATLVLDDNAGGNDDEKDDKGTQTNESETPPARKVVKKRPSDPTTPTKARPKVSRFTRHLTADRKKKDEQPLSPAPQTPTLPTVDNTAGDTNPEPNSDESSSSSSSSSSADFALDSSTAAQIGPAAANPDFTSEPVPTIRVLPPALAFHDQVLPGLLWASPLGSTSRPALPWTWCKRWTCCRCAGGTIVEQVVCSKLSCGHRRCGARCVVFEGRGGSVM
jgi:hypothetical protein